MVLHFDGEGLLEQSLSILQGCGKGRRECVVLWLGPHEMRGQVSRVVHPDHSSSRGGYRIDGAWLSELWGMLADRKERILAQVHTHPGVACHSRTDDRFPITFTPGLYSLVIPNFAQPPHRRRDWYLAELQADGSWRERDWTATTR